MRPINSTYNTPVFSVKMRKQAFQMVDNNQFPHYNFRKAFKERLCGEGKGKSSCRKPFFLTRSVRIGRTVSACKRIFQMNQGKEEEELL